jgi:hypothetical protein
MNKCTSLLPVKLLQDPLEYCAAVTTNRKFVPTIDGTNATATGLALLMFILTVKLASNGDDIAVKAVSGIFIVVDPDVNVDVDIVEY